MTRHYKHLPPEFEPYKICNNANFNGNLQQIFQYVARRKHKGNEIGDLKKALDFVEFEVQGKELFDGDYTSYEISDDELHTDFIKYCFQNDGFLGLIYMALTTKKESFISNTDPIKALLRLEISRVENNIDVQIPFDTLKNDSMLKNDSIFTVEDSKVLKLEVVNSSYGITKEGGKEKAYIKQDLNVTIIHYFPLESPEGKKVQDKI